MWFGFRGISRFDGTTFQSFPATDLLTMPVMKMQASKDGPLWLGTYGSGLLRYDATNFTAIPSPKECFRLALGPEGTIWFGSYDRGLCRYSPTGSTNPSELRNFTKSDGLMENSVIGGIHFTPDGVLWVGAGNGVSRFDGTNFVNFTVVDGLPGYNVSSIVTTADGMHWFGTEGGGLIRYDPKSFESYTTADGLSDNDVLAGHRLPDGTLWVGTGINPLRESGLNRLQEERFIEVPLPDDDKGRVKRFRAISDGVLVVGEFARAPAYRLEHSMLVPVFTGTEPRVSGSVDVLAASDGSIWLAGGKDDGTWSTGSAAKAWQAQRGVDGTWKLRSFSPADFAGEQPMPDLISLGLDNQGRIWTGWYVGVGRYENGEWRLFTLKDGLAGDRIEMIGQIGMAHFGSPPTAACRDSMERISSTLRVRRAGSPAILFSSFSGTREAISGWGRIAV
jgi:ligand-binding sensor domain-containing protein